MKLFDHQSPYFDGYLIVVKLKYLQAVTLMIDRRFREHIVPLPDQLISLLDHQKLPFNIHSFQGFIK
jgi:hypothetical protein